MVKGKLYWFITLLLLTLSLDVFCQTDIDSTVIDVDSVAVPEIKSKDKGYGVFDMFDGNPGRAALYSLVVPGGGQFYNKRYLKVAVVWAAQGFASYYMIQRIKDYRLSDQFYRALLDGHPQIIDGIPVSDPVAYNRTRLNLRQSMENSYLIIGAIHLVNIADAFVDRHLIEFDVEDDISFRIRPASSSLGIGLVATF